MNLDIKTVAFEPYHSGKPSRVSQIPLEQRRFIAWDGEGINLDGDGKPQSYVLFGCSTGERILKRENISTMELIDFIIDIGEKNVGAIHIGFSFKYDSNMILRTLREKTLERLHKNGYVTMIRPDGLRYRIEYRPGKWLQLTKYPRNSSKANNRARTTVRIYDIFGFFACSFIKAYEDLIGPVPETITSGKANRSTFTLQDLDDGTVEKYWLIEIAMMQELAEVLRKRLYGAGLRINQWHGPGALASFVLRQHAIKDYMAVAPDEVREAARYAYLGGRFERFLLGRHNGKVFSLDINSAYPHAIRQLPCLNTGRWVYASGSHIMGRHSLNKFGVYRIRLHPRDRLSALRNDPSPLFHRDVLGNVSYPWRVNGWYWYPEAINIIKHIRPHLYTIEGGWELITDEKTVYPYDWVTDAYRQRQEWKAQGIPSQMALKLMLNSLYGKMAQRVGWDEEKRTAPTYHQLEWAGWVTSYCRAMLWQVMRKLPKRSLIAVETDGIYTTTDPATLGITNSKELGGWEVEEYDEILYVQSGLAWLRKGTEWTCKRRGLDASTFKLSDCINYLSTLEPRTIWAPYSGQTTRFIGLGAALASDAPTKVRHCVWETKEREVNAGLTGKRVHVYDRCKACQEDKTAYEGLHDMMIKPIRYPDSNAHKIPWENDFDKDYSWRDTAEIELSMIH